MSAAVLVSGANGFVGRTVVKALIERGDDVIGLVRRPQSDMLGVREWVLEGDGFAGIEDRWPPSYRCGSVIHLAARVHMMQDTATDPLAAYRETNVRGTLRLAKASHAAGAQRFVFVSSVKAVGNSDHGRPLREFDQPAPNDPYGVSKLEAEQALLAYGVESGLEIVIVRPPLVYGPGVRANFLRLMHGIAAGVPLPLGAIPARRSMIFVGNLAHVLIQCATDPRAAGRTFNVTDTHDLTVTELARMLAAKLNAPARFLAVPASWLRFAGTLTHKTEQVERLISSLQLDTSLICEVLNWHPPYSTEEGLSLTAAWYRSTH
ncbi:putative epimerase/dehydratase WbiG [Caballeronia sordidicola]|uniref:Putative epimerase/dehydratase WbiG n=1 Tax=Caballeronia sordidicola TaxID=196367 RepID=A0A158I3A8_CABSO|nr:NAD-dependent epimerase/dehydratase family protein [Caballeronia sordidicola]SAL51092.1 putative epimerase/dehydratase WbiG [Caballeronia sordidicola]